MILRPVKTYKDGCLYHGNCLKVMKRLPEQSVDLVVGSPPYEDKRTYGEELNFRLKGQDWVDWMVEIFKASLRVCRGLVAFVVGHGKGARRWSGTPALLIADLLRSGVNLRSPLYYKRNGIMGSGGPDWMRADVEFIVCATNGRMRLPHSDNTACGHPPKAQGVGGAISKREKDGVRLTEKTRNKVRRLMETEGLTQRDACRKLGLGLRTSPSGTDDSGTIVGNTYVPPEKSNPGNVIDCGAVGGGHLGSFLAHENEAPYPEKVPDFIIRSFSAVGDVVLDPFCGSGTTIATAILNNRKFIGIDLRESQIELTKRRVREARLRRGFGVL